MIEALFRGFEEAGVQWCLLRGEAELDAPPADVDLLVARLDLERARAVLRGVGFAQLPSYGYDQHHFFLTYHSESDRWIKLDVVDELRFGSDYTLETGVEDECLSRRRRINGIALLAHEDAFWALLLHCLLDKRKVAPHRGKALAELAAEADGKGPLAPLVEAACPPGWTTERIISSARRGDWDALLDLAPRLEERWPRQKQIGTVGRALNRVRRKANSHPPFGRPSLNVALLAPDGTGKSTLAASLADSFYFPARSLYMGFDQRRPDATPNRTPPGIGLGLRLFRAWHQYLNAKVHEARGRVVIFDRYTYDYRIPPVLPPTRSRRFRRWVLAHACPGTDLVIVLDAPGEVIYARKQEHPLRVLEERRRVYRHLAERLDHAVVVDASREADEVRREVESVIWAALAARLRRD